MKMQLELRDHRPNFDQRPNLDLRQDMAPLDIDEPPPTDETRRHIYFGVPCGSDTDRNAFSGQYLRLEEYVGGDEDPHLPASLSTSNADGTTSRADPKGILLSATGYLLVNAKVGVHETYGKALTEAISGGDHIITIEKGDWTLVAEKGSIKIETKSTDDAGKMSLTSTGSDIVFKALKGKASTSDKIDKKTSKTNTVTFVAGFEYSGVHGTVTKENIGLLMNINVAGDISVKVLDVKTEAFPFKFGQFSYSFGVAAMKFQAISAKFGVIDAKKMIVYNKINVYQIYNEMGKSESTLIKDDITLTSMSQKLAAAEIVASDCKMTQLLKM